MGRRHPTAVTGCGCRSGTPTGTTSGRDQRHRDDRRGGRFMGARLGARRERPGGLEGTCAARPASWRPARNAPTSPASCTTRSPRRCSR
jgi:hypothetical protein